MVWVVLYTVHCIAPGRILLYGLYSHIKAVPFFVSVCLPQGGWEDDETVEIAAQRETMEEAGVRGVLEVRYQQVLQISAVGRVCLATANSPAGASLYEVDLRVNSTPHIYHLV